MMRSFADWLTIGAELMAIYEVHRPAPGKSLAVPEILKIADGCLAVLAKHNVTILELQQLLQSIGPLLALLRFQR